jgi:hypothetical protein
VNEVQTDLHRLPRLPPRWVAVAFGTGLLLALATSGGIAEERVTLGAPHVALLVNAVTTVAALVAVVITMRRTRVFFVGEAGRDRPLGRLYALAVLAPQIVGAVVGVVLVHAALHYEVVAAVPWLSERPAQFVNDAVAVAGFLALVWASADGLDVRVLVVALVGVTAYKLTSATWHVDRAPGGVYASIQELVVAQLVAAALALGLFRTAVGRANR